ncbi:MAG: peptidyl-prolyl cis-trans isomerase [Prevotellaceae bacterium]|jgi:hypothetical protein|nr:peptidyl-prolyl cis-trans isomerase [Prevotellaceae bacterium]
MRQKIVILLITSLLMLSCAPKRQRNETPIAEAGAKKLYLSDIKEYLHNLSPEDSVTILTDYVNKWAKNQSVLRYAENNLSDEDKNIDKEIDDYRTSLLIYKYEQKYIRSKMDTTVSEAEIEQFYKNNPDNFQLTGILVKALYIKVATDFKSIDRIRQLYRSNREGDIEELEKIALSGVDAYSTFNGEWMLFSEIVALLPGSEEVYENRVIRMRAIEDSDENYFYFLKINDISMKGTLAPLEHVRSNIKDIIINRRKINTIRQMENLIFKEAMNRNEIKINR